MLSESLSKTATDIRIEFQMIYTITEFNGIACRLSSLLSRLVVRSSHWMVGKITGGHQRRNLRRNGSSCLKRDLMRLGLKFREWKVRSLSGVDCIG